MSYFNDDGFGSRIADNIINESGFFDIGEEEKNDDMKRLSKREENAIVNRLIDLMTGRKRKRYAKKKV